MYNNFYPYGGMGMIPNQNQQMPKTGSWLPADKYAILQKAQDQFKLSVTDEEIAKGQCNHYHPNGTSALIADPDGSGAMTCTICGTKFTSREYSEEDVKNATQNILDILNTIKIMYLSIDPTAALEYFQIIPFINKIPKLYNIAINDFKKYEGVNNFMNPQQQNPFNIFAMMNNPMAYQQPPMGYYQAPQVAYQQPMQQPMMNGFAQQNPGFNQNPLYSNPTPMMNTNMPVQPQAPVAQVATPAATGYQPIASGYAFNPQGAAAPAAPADAETVKVDTNFKK